MNFLLAFWPWRRRTPFMPDASSDPKRAAIDAALKKYALPSDYESQTGLSQEERISLLSRHLENLRADKARFLERAEGEEDSSLLNQLNHEIEHVEEAVSHLTLQRDTHN